MSFKNKVVIVTGASAGIGATTAVFFAKECANVVLIGRNEANLKEVAKQCAQYGNKQLPIIADLVKDAEVRRVLDNTIAAFGKLDILVNNAGMGIMGCLTDGKLPEAYDKMMSVNIRSVVLLTTLATPYLVKSKGNIINISSVTGKKVKAPMFMGYCMTKAALDIFTRGAALELSSSGVRVNAVSPGPVTTGFHDTAGIMNADDEGKGLPLKRASTTEEVANLILYLASDKAIGITGADFLCDNGYLL